MRIRLALVGDHDERVRAHVAIPQAIRLAADSLNVSVSEEWLPTDEIRKTDLSIYSGIWCVPASPYMNDENAMQAIRHARERSVPFLGTCGGYQYAVLEFARNELGHVEAQNQEVFPCTEFPLIAALACRLVERTDTIVLKDGSSLAKLYGKSEIEEGYHCSFGVNRRYLSLFEGSALGFEGFDAQGDPRAFVLKGHPFFIGTAFQPERSAFEGMAHPIILQFVSAATDYANKAGEARSASAAVDAP